MCGRYRQNTGGDKLAEILRAHRRTPRPDGYGTVSPGMDLPAVRENSTGRFMDELFWGFVPHWAKDDKGSRFINARAETVAEKPSFRYAYRLRRCVIPADSFIEWDERTTPKTPYEVALASHAPFVFAGVWDRWANPENGAFRDAFAILTIAAPPALAPHHPRMPVMLAAADDIDRWLARDTAPETLAGIAARAASLAFDVRPAEDVGPPARKVPETPEETRQGSLF